MASKNSSVNSNKNVKNPLFSSGIANFAAEEFTQGIVLVPQPKDSEQLLSKGLGGEVDTFLGQDVTDLGIGQIPVPITLDSNRPLAGPTILPPPPPASTLTNFRAASIRLPGIRLVDNVPLPIQPQPESEPDFKQIPLDDSVPLYNPSAVLKSTHPVTHELNRIIPPLEGGVPLYDPSRLANVLPSHAIKRPLPIKNDQASVLSPSALDPAYTSLSKHISTCSPSLVIDSGPPESPPSHEASRKSSSSSSANELPSTLINSPNYRAPTTLPQSHSASSLYTLPSKSVPFSIPFNQSSSNPSVYSPAAVGTNFSTDSSKHHLGSLSHSSEPLFSSNLGNTVIPPLPSAPQIHGPSAFSSSQPVNHVIVTPSPVKLNPSEPVSYSASVPTFKSDYLVSGQSEILTSVSYPINNGNNPSHLVSQQSHHFSSSASDSGVNSEPNTSNAAQNSNISSGSEYTLSSLFNQFNPFKRDPAPSSPKTEQDPKSIPKDSIIPQPLSNTAFASYVSNAPLSASNLPSTNPQSEKTSPSPSLPAPPLAPPPLTGFQVSSTPLSSLPHIHHSFSNNQNPYSIHSQKKNPPPAFKPEHFFTPIPVVDIPKEDSEGLSNAPRHESNQAPHVISSPSGTVESSVIPSSSVSNQPLISSQVQNNFLNQVPVTSFPGFVSPPQPSQLNTVLDNSCSDSTPAVKQSCHQLSTSSSLPSLSTSSGTIPQPSSLAPPPLSGFQVPSTRISPKTCNNVPEKINVIPLYTSEGQASSTTSAPLTNRESDAFQLPTGQDQVILDPSTISSTSQCQVTHLTQTSSFNQESNNFVQTFNTSQEQSSTSCLQSSSSQAAVVSPSTINSAPVEAASFPPSSKGFPELATSLHTNDSYQEQVTLFSKDSFDINQHLVEPISSSVTSNNIQESFGGNQPPLNVLNKPDDVQSNQTSYNPQVPQSLFTFPPSSNQGPPPASSQTSAYRLSSLKRPAYVPVPDLSVSSRPNVMAYPQETYNNVNQGVFQPQLVQSHINTMDEPSMTSHTQPNVQPFTSMAVSQTYRPVYHHWFYRRGDDQKNYWFPFSMADSLNLEQQYTSDVKPEGLVATDGGRYDVEVDARRRKAVYWHESEGEVRRCSWFVKGPVDSRYQPYDENIAALLEEEYKTACSKNEWNRRVELADGEVIIIHSPNTIAHHQRSSSPDPWGNPPPMQEKPRIVKRGLDEFDIPEGEPTQVDHLLLLVHGIGKACDLRFRSLVEVVDDFRTISVSLVGSHYKTAVERGKVGRVEVLPVEWHRALHTDVIDQRLADITLPSIPKARQFTNETLLDVLFYTSPVFCERIVQAVGAELNRVYTLYLKRNPGYKGGVSLGGHSLGSLILFDMLCHQKPPNPKTQSTPSFAVDETDEDIASLGCLKTRAKLSRRMSYLSIGTAGAGQPYITYPQLQFQPRSFFALGSPIGMFVTVRGVESLGEEFHFPTCPSFYNIFHPNDPVAYRIEGLINPDMAHHPAVLIPHHKGRKRMHLELKETMAHVTAALKQKLLDSMKNTWNTVSSLTRFSRIDPAVLENQVDKVIDDEILCKDEFSSSVSESVEAETSFELKVGQLNGGSRIDYVLQEAPLETFNQYISAIRSHLVYWESEDTMLLILKEIYNAKGITADSQVAQPILPFDLTLDGDEDPGTAYSHYSVSSTPPLSRQSTIAEEPL